MPSEKFNLETALKNLSTEPGIYRMYAANDELIYIGKAKNLRNRVRNYFLKNNAQHSPKTIKLVEQIARFDTIVTNNEIEALILEDSLVKHHHPKYNILLRDDKRYPWLALSSEPFPRLYMTRQPAKNTRKNLKEKSFGPYTQPASMYESLRVLRKHFPMRQRRKPLFKNRPCMNFFIGTCPGPCQELVTKEDYAKTVYQVELFLKGKGDELLKLIEKDMQAASDAMNFEWAAKLRNRYYAVETVMESRQKVLSPDTALNLDIIAAVSDGAKCMVVVQNVRHGKLIGSHPQEILLQYGATIEEAFEAFLEQYYQDLDPAEIPDELILQFTPEDPVLVEAWLNTRKQSRRKITLTFPQKGLKQEFLSLAIKNAKETLDQVQFAEAASHKSDPSRGLLELQEALGLPDYPARMECYDISHVQGDYTVASMVVFTDGQPDKKEYRRFKIKSAEGKPDDFTSMHEVICRRFAHTGESKWDDPDLVIIDGGKGQLSAAQKGLKDAGVEEQPMISLAKKFEEVYVPDNPRPVILGRDSRALFLLQQIRDEAHRFAITYHRGLRAKAATASILDDVPGLGEKRKQFLLEQFGSLEGIKQANSETLSKKGRLPQKVAETLYQMLRTSP